MKEMIIYLMFELDGIQLATQRSIISTKVLQQVEVIQKLEKLHILSTVIPMPQQMEKQPIIKLRL